MLKIKPSNSVRNVPYNAKIIAIAIGINIVITAPNVPRDFLFLDILNE